MIRTYYSKKILAPTTKYTGCYESGSLIDGRQVNIIIGGCDKMPLDEWNNITIKVGYVYITCM